MPNNGDLNVIERIHLAEPDVLHDDLEIIAPHVLKAPWRTTRTYYRDRVRAHAFVEGVCLQGSFTAGHDEHGAAIFVPVPQKDGNAVYPGR